MDILVAGAGIAALTAGIALHRACHRIHIYERSFLNEEFGATINLPPNAGRFLLSWGLNPVECRSVSHKHANNFDGYELWYAHRVDLHNALSNLATDSAGPGTPVTTHTNSFVVGYEGRTGLSSQPKHCNYCYRLHIPAEVIESDPENRWWNKDSKGLTRLFPHNETSRRLVAYACRNGEVRNFNAIFYDEGAKNASREGKRTQLPSNNGPLTGFQFLCVDRQGNCIGKTQGLQLQDPCSHLKDPGKRQKSSDGHFYTGHPFLHVEKGKWL
ncbi:putative FAD binding domain-containing protein [Seiridium unicorne]|uniref:FAD binding domain-containing protein n=1 Tax=Seiridium unicorne TaxID=138068 RepID=A0ABR2UTG9_9PEZI